MPRSRNLKPGFFANEVLAECPFEFRLLFEALWCLADRAGRLEDRPGKIKAFAFPNEQDMHVDVRAGLVMLEEKGFIVRYLAEAKRYIAIPQFNAHQNPHKREAVSRIPPPAGTPPEPAAEPAKAVAPAAPANPPPPADPEPKVPKPRKKREKPPVGQESYSAGFERFWDAYPATRRTNKLGAYAVWQREGLEQYTEVLTTDIAARLTRDWNWVKEENRYVPMPVTYLNGRRWNDAMEQPPTTLGARSKLEADNDSRAQKWADGKQQPQPPTKDIEHE